MRFGFLTPEGQNIGHFSIEPFPGNGSVCISTDSFIVPWMRRKGYGTQMDEKRVSEALQMGYTYMLCTVRLDNKAEQALLKKRGWVYLDNICHSEDYVQLYGRAL